MPAALLQHIDGVALDVQDTLIFPSSDRRHPEALARRLEVELQPVKAIIAKLADGFGLGETTELERMRKIISALGQTQPTEALTRDLAFELIDVEHSECLKPMQFFPRVHWVIAELNRLRLLPVLCSDDNEVGYWVADQLGLLSLVYRRAVYSCRIKAAKPSRIMYTSVGDMIQTDLNRIVMVDNDADGSLGGAWEAGMVTVHCNQGFNRPISDPTLNHPHADFTITRIGDLIDLLTTADYPERLR